MVWTGRGIWIEDFPQSLRPEKGGPTLSLHEIKWCRRWRLLLRHSSCAGIPERAWYRGLRDFCPDSATRWGHSWKSFIARMSSFSSPTSAATTSTTLTSWMSSPSPRMVGLSSSPDSACILRNNVRDCISPHLTVASSTLRTDPDNVTLLATLVRDTAISSRLFICGMHVFQERFFEEYTGLISVVFRLDNWVRGSKICPVTFSLL